MIYISFVFISAVLLYPVLSKKELDLFNPFIFFTISVSFGVFARTVYLRGYGLTMPYDLSLWYLKAAIILFMVGVCAMVGGYSLGIGNRIARSVDLPDENKLSWVVLRVFSTAFLTVGVYSSFIFLEEVGLYNIVSNISAKRSVENAYTTWGIEMTYVSLLLEYLISQEKKKSVNVFSGLKLLILIYYLAFGFIVSSRGTILRALIVPLVVHNYNNRKVGIKTAIGGGTSFLVLFGIVGDLRPRSYTTGFDILSYFRGGFFDKIRRPFVEGHYMFDITTLAKTIQGVPGQMDFQYGKTLFTWLVMPIPRSMWEEKPRALGQLVGEAFYNRPSGIVGGGVPPPLVADFYLNFHVVGVVVGMFLFGVVVKAVYAFVNINENNILACIMYAILLLTIISMFNGGVSKPIVKFLKLAVPLSFAISCSYVLSK